jgi:hypothetical protein
MPMIGFPRSTSLADAAVLLCLSSPLPDSSLAGQEHGRTIPSADIDGLPAIRTRSRISDFHCAWLAAMLYSVLRGDARILDLRECW